MSDNMELVENSQLNVRNIKAAGGGARRPFRAFWFPRACPSMRIVILTTVTSANTGNLPGLVDWPSARTVLFALQAASHD
jgi:hypothetical protein